MPLYQLILVVCAVGGIIIEALTFAYLYGKHVQLLEDHGERIDNLEKSVNQIPAFISSAISLSEARMVERISHVHESIKELRDQLFKHFQRQGED